MPTEQLFGAYHFQIHAVGDGPADSFDFRGDGMAEKTGLLLPAVQSVSTTDLNEATGGRRDDSANDAGDDEWIDVLSTDWGMPRPAADTGKGLRSDGDLVQSVHEVDLGGDFIL